MSSFKRRAAAGALLVAGLVSGNAANAGLLTLTGDNTPPPNGPLITYTSTTPRSTISCTGTCEGLLSNLPTGIYTADVPDVTTADGFSTTFADVFFLPNNNVATELAFVNAVVDPDFAAAASGQIAGGGGHLTFTSSALYILLKIGATPDMALIHNISGGAQTYTYTQLQASGAGLSHYVEFGTTTEVPEPGSIAL